MTFILVIIHDRNQTMRKKKPSPAEEKLHGKYDRCVDVTEHTM